MKIDIKIKGMTCPSCSVSVEKLIDQLDGIKTKNINHVLDLGMIEFDENIVSKQEILAKINEGHYKVDTDEEIIENKKDVLSCPTCNNFGQLVPNTVFNSNLKSKSKKKIDLEKENYICLTPSCETVYYSENLAINKIELKRELWYKEGSKRKIICYCNNIDKSQIKTAITSHNLTTWEEITSHYRVKVIEKCEILNPTGYCCRNTFDKVVNKLKTQ